MYYRHEVKGEKFERGDKLLGRIPISECKTRRLYRVDTRNFGPIAVFDAEHHNGFFGVRRKFGYIRIDVEYHWENGPPHGTANPWEELPEELPPEIELRQSCPTECKNCHKRVEWRSDKTGTNDGPTPGKWFHLEATECTECFPISYEYKPLMEWLKQMELKYWHPAGEKPEWLDPKKMFEDERGGDEDEDDS